MLSNIHAYMVRAVYEWALDNKCTPYIEVDAEENYVTVPREYVKEGKIILNISPQTVEDFQIKNDFMTFRSRFGGVMRQVKIPIFMVMRIYAYENGIGMIFREAKDINTQAYPMASNMRGKPKLRLITTKEDEEKKI